MANRRKDRQVPDGYRKYDGEYEKTFYDVYTYNGAVIHHCWPNAGIFHSGTGQYIHGKDVFAIKACIESGSSDVNELVGKGVK